MMSTFKVGDVVTLSEYGKRHIGTGQWAEAAMKGGGSNPWGISGVVVEVDKIYDDGDLPIKVDWSNQQNNSYSSFDLDFFNLNLENK